MSTLTPSQKAASMIADHDLRWDEGPTRAVTVASTKATQHALANRGSQAAYWTRVSVLLSLAAGTEPGAVVQTMAERYGVSLEADAEVVGS